MHSYRKMHQRFEVYFDAGPEESFALIKTFENEVDAVFFVGFLNGGGAYSVEPNFLQTMLARGVDESEKEDKQ